jgi:3-oxoacyl-[acyl-carrier protein] reductase
MSKLQGKVAVVTGASKGIGAAIAAKLGSEGASVVVNYASDKAGAERVVKAVQEKGGKALAVQADVSKKEQVKKLFQETKKAFGAVDVLVNNAGVYEFKPLEEVDEQHYRRLFDINVLGLLFASQEAAAIIGKNGGSIINISSIASKTPPPGGSVYSGTKGAVDVITRSLAQELGPRRIRVNTLAPGATDTEGIHANGGPDPNFVDHVLSRTPLGRMGTVDDIANAALFLASEDSGWITGEELLVGGGIRL